MRKNVHDQKSCTLLNGPVMVKGAKKSPKCLSLLKDMTTLPYSDVGPPTLPHSDRYWYVTLRQCQQEPQ